MCPVKLGFTVVLLSMLLFGVFLLLATQYFTGRLELSYIYVYVHVYTYMCMNVCMDTFVVPQSIVKTGGIFYTIPSARERASTCETHIHSRGGGGSVLLALTDVCLCECVRVIIVYN